MLGIDQFPKASTPMAELCHPESDDSPLLSSDQATKYRGLLGSANWIITLGRFDIAYAVNSLARFGMQPRAGHMRAMQRIFGYLRQYPEGHIPIDPNFRKLEDHTKHGGEKHHWVEYYPDAEEMLPPDQPEPITEAARISLFMSMLTMRMMS